ncbi:hypothetical protein NKI51_31970, partial [Mesorhizobium australicum]
FLVRQRTQIGNAIRAHMTEFGVIAAKGAPIGQLLNFLFAGLSLSTSGSWANAVASCAGARRLLASH